MTWLKALILVLVIFTFIEFLDTFSISIAMGATIAITIRNKIISIAIIPFR